jgi:hypothetical protein
MLSYSLAGYQPELIDGLVLQGLAFKAAFFPDFVLPGHCIPVSTLISACAPGYFAAGNTAAMQTNFFAQGQFDLEILPWAYYYGQPVSIGELLTNGGTLNGTSAMTGPVMVITRERDLPFCVRDRFAKGDPNLSSTAAMCEDHFQRQVRSMSRSFLMEVRL